MSLSIEQNLKTLEVRLIGSEAREVLAHIEPCAYDLARLYRRVGFCRDWPEAVKVAWRDLKTMVRPK